MEILAGVVALVIIGFLVYRAKTRTKPTGTGSANPKVGGGSSGSDGGPLNKK